MRYQNFFQNYLLLNAFAMKRYQKLILEKFYFAFSVTSNKDIIDEFLKFISQKVLVKLQTDTVFAQFLPEIIIFHNATHQTEAAVHGCSVLGCPGKFLKN